MSETPLAIRRFGAPAEERDLQSDTSRFLAFLRIGCVGLGFGLWILGCGDGKPAVEPKEADLQVVVPAVGTPEALEVLRKHLEKGAQPGTMEPFERREVEELVRALMPRNDGDLIGHRWDVKYMDMPGVDFVSIELMRGDGFGGRQVWMQLLPMGDKPLSGFEPGDLEPVGTYRARGLAGHHLFVRLGQYDLRIVTDFPDIHDDAYLRNLLLGCRLDDIAAL